MGHQPRHAPLARAAKSLSWPARITLTAVSACAIAGAGTGLAATASAAATPLSVTLSACGTGASAIWGADGDPVLTSGTAVAGACGAPAGSTYDPSYAQMAVNGVSGAVVPVSEPRFDIPAGSYVTGSGDPRWVIDLNNGKSMFGYPPEAGLKGSDMTWAVGPSGTYASYGTVYDAVDAVSTTVKDAYIVTDASTAGHPQDLSNIQYGGEALAPEPDVVTVTSPGNQSSTVGSTVSLQIRASSSKGDHIASYAALSLPGGLVINATTGLITGTPTTVGQSAVVVTATDNGGTSGEVSFVWTVAAAPPTQGPGMVSSFTNHSFSCLDNSNFTWQAYNPLQLWRCGAAGGVDQQIELTTLGGAQVLQFVAPAGTPGGPFCVTAPNGIGRLVLGVCKAGAKRQQVTAIPGAGNCGCGVYFRFANSDLVMNDWAWDTANGAAVGTWPLTYTRNEGWGLP